MIKIILATGATYEGETYSDIVMQLKLEDWTKYNNREDYKRNINRRVMIFKGEKIQYNDDKSFIHELKRIGFIKEVQE